MTADAMLVVRFIFTSVWRFFNSWYIPGTNVTPAGMAYFLVASIFLLKVVKLIIFGGDNSGD